MITKADIEKYFIAEKQEALVFICVGVAAIVVAMLGLLLWKTQFWKGAAIPLILIALLQLIVGYTIYNRSDADRVRVVYALDMNPNDLKTKELPRMIKVNKSFVMYRYVQIALLTIGTLIALAYKSNIEKKFLFGIGVALVIQALIMLAADSIAEKRALHYTKLLQEKVNKIQ